MPRSTKGGNQRTRWTQAEYDAYVARTTPTVVDKKEEVPLGEFLREKELQARIYSWLLFHEVYFEWDATHRRTSGKRGRADFRVCVKGPDGFGRWLSLECKVDGNTLTREQASEAARLRKSGGVFAVVRSLEEAIQAIAELS